MKVLEIQFTDPESKMEVHMLQPGQVFERFGGSSHGLVVRKTASLITRAETAGGTDDIERDVHDANFWAFIARCINGEIKVTATTIKEISHEEA